MTTIHYSSIADYFAFLGKPPPEHPLLACVDVKTDTSGLSPDCPELHDATTADFYIISLKNVTEGEVLYGQTHYDCKSGTMLFIAPNQELCWRGIRVKGEGRVLLIHPDYFVGHTVEDSFKNCAYFEYTVNEALHLAPAEEKQMLEIFDSISEECQSRYDDCSREIILSYVKTLLSFSQRFYNRQFTQRREVEASLFAHFTAILESHYNTLDQVDLPQLTDIADSMQLSSRYLSDALKAETGKSAKECMQLFIIDRAKRLLRNTDDSITTIAYQLGYNYPQYFVRLFKKKTDMTPSEFRESIH